MPTPDAWWRALNAINPPGSPKNPVQGGDLAAMFGRILAQQGAAAKGANIIDLLDPAGAQKRNDPLGYYGKLNQRMGLLAADGMQSTFVSGLRGSGGPSLAASTEAAGRDKWLAPPTPPTAAPAPVAEEVNDPYARDRQPLGQPPPAGKGWWKSANDWGGRP